MSKSVKKVGVAILSVIMAVCLSVGLALYFSQAPIALAVSVNTTVHNIVAGEDNFTYEKEGDLVKITGLTTAFTDTYKNGGSKNTDGKATYNVRLDIPERLQNAHGDIPAGAKVDYVDEHAFEGDYYEENGVITFRITDVHTPESVYWQATSGGIFKLANEFNYGEGDSHNVTRKHLEGEVVGDGVNDADKKANWAWMLGANDGKTATVYDLDLSKFAANFIVPSPMWYDQNGDGNMEDGELFANVELLIDEQVKSGAADGGNLRNMVISSGVTRFFSPYEKSSRIKIEDTFRTSDSDTSQLTGMHFATGRTTVLSLYGLAFQRFSSLNTITLSAGVLLADGARVFQGDTGVEVMDIASENNSNVPSFYVKGNNGAIYTGDYRYSYYDTAGYRKYLVWDYVTRYNKNLGDTAFQSNEENGGYKASASSAAALASNSQLSPDSGISTIAAGDSIEVFFEKRSETITNDFGEITFGASSTTQKLTYKGEEKTVYRLDGSEVSITPKKDITLTAIAASNGGDKLLQLHTGSKDGTIVAQTPSFTTANQMEEFEFSAGGNSSAFVLKANTKYYITRNTSHIYLYGLIIKEYTALPQNGITATLGEKDTLDLAKPSEELEVTLTATGSATLTSGVSTKITKQGDSTGADFSDNFTVSEISGVSNTITVKLNEDSLPPMGDYTLTFTANSTYTASVTIHVNDSTPAKIEITSTIEKNSLVSYYVGQKADAIEFEAVVTGKDGKIIPDYKNITWAPPETGGNSIKYAPKDDKFIVEPNTDNEFASYEITITASIKGMAEITDSFTFELEVKEVELADYYTYNSNTSEYDGGIGLYNGSIVIDFGTEDFGKSQTDIKENGLYQYGANFEVHTLATTSFEGKVATINKDITLTANGDNPTVENNKATINENATSVTLANKEYTGSLKVNTSRTFTLNIGFNFNFKAYFTKSKDEVRNAKLYSGTSVNESNLIASVLAAQNYGKNNINFRKGSDGLLYADNLVAGDYTFAGDSSNQINLIAIVITPTEAPDSIEADKTELTLAIPKADETTSGSVILTAVGDAAKEALTIADNYNISITEHHDGITATLGEYAEKDGTATRPINIEVTSIAKAGDYTLAFTMGEYSIEVKITVIDPTKPTALVLNRTFITIETDRATEFSAELLFGNLPAAPENLSDLLKNVTWTISGEPSADGWLTGQEVKDNKSIIILTPAEEGAYTLTATYSDNGFELKAECKVVVTKGVDRILDTEAPEYNVTDQYVAYQKLVYVPPQLKNGDKLLDTFTFDYAATTIIGNSAFTATSIQVIVIPDRIAKIEDYAFRYTNALRIVYLPSNATYGDAVFGEFKDWRPGTNSQTVGKMSFSKQDFLTGYKNNDFLLIAPSRQAYDSLLTVTTENEPSSIDQTGITDTEHLSGDRGALFRRAANTMTSSISDGADGIIGIFYDYRPALTYEVEMVIGDRSITVLYNQMDSAGNLYYKDGLDYKHDKTWTELVGSGSVYYGSTEITGSTIKALITGNLDGVDYVTGTNNSPGVFTNTDTTSVDKWQKSAARPTEYASPDYTGNTKRLPASITLMVDSGEQIDSTDVTLPTFQPIGEQVPDGEKEYPEITVMFDFAGYPYSRIFEGFDSNRMTADYTYIGIGGHTVNGGSEKLTESNAEYPYDAGTYTITLKVNDGLNWTGTYNGLPIASGDSEYTFILNIQKRDVPVPGNQQVLYTEATGAEVAVFENNAFYDVVKYSAKITGSDTISKLGVLDKNAEARPYQRGSYWVALELVDDYNLQWVAEGNAVVSDGSEYYQAIGENISGKDTNEKFVTCELIISDAPRIGMPSWTTDRSIGSYSGTQFTAEYRTQGYAFSDIFFGYLRNSMRMEIAEYTPAGSTEATALPNTILNAGTYTITFAPATGYAWAEGTSGCGHEMEVIDQQFEVTVEITKKILETPPQQTQFLEEGKADGQFEFVPASDATWTVEGYGAKNAETNTEFKPETTFEAGTYQVKVKLADTENYAWRNPMASEPACTITELVIRSLDSLTIDAPVKKNDATATYTGRDLPSANYIDYDTSLKRAVSEFTYDTYKDGTYGTATAEPSPATIRDAGNYKIKFTLPDDVSGYAYTWTGGGTDPRTIGLTVEKQEITNVSANATINVKLSGGVARLPSQYLNSELYTVQYAKKSAEGNLTNGIPSAKGAYTVTLTLTEAAYRNYYFSGTTKSEGGNKYYPASITVTLSVGLTSVVAPSSKGDYTYNGALHSFDDALNIPEASKPNIYSDGDNLYTVSYTKPDGTGTTSAVTEIKYAGEYKFTFRLANDEDYTWSIASGNTSATYDEDGNLVVTVTVKQAELEVTLSATGKTYDGTDTANVTGTIGAGSGLLEGDTVAVGTIVATFEDANAGEDKTITVESVTLGGADAYNYTATYSDDGLKADIDKLNITITWDNVEDLVYNGANQTPTPKLPSEGIPSVDQDNPDKLSVRAVVTGEHKDAGKEYTATAELAGTSANNYNIDDGSKTQTYSINQATITIGGAYTDSKPYDGGVYSKTVSAPGNGLTVASSAGSATTTTAQVTITTSGKDHGEYTEDDVSLKANISVSLTDSTNFKYEIKASVTVTITTVQINLPALGNATYNGKKQDAAQLAKSFITGVNSESLTYDVDYTVSYSKGGESVEPKDAGTYTVTVSLKDTSTAGNYTLANEGKTEYTIDPYSISGGALWGAKTIYEYSGEPQKPTAQIASPFDGDLTLDVSVTANSESHLTDGSAVDVGSYTATATLNNPNYTFTEETHEFSITTKQITVQSAKFASKVYDGTTTVNTALESITFNGIVSRDSELNNKDLVASIVAEYISKDVAEAVQINITSVTLRGGEDYHYAASNYKINYTPQSATGAITQAELDVSVDDLAKTYSGEGQGATIVLTGKGSDKLIQDRDYTVSYSKSGEPVEGLPVNAGTYSIAITLIDDSNVKAATNYKPVTVNDKFVISPATIISVNWYKDSVSTDNILTSGNSYIYDGQHSVLVRGVGVSGNAVELSLVDIYTYKDVQSYEFTASVSDGNYTLDSSVNTLTITVTPKPITVTVTVTKYYDNSMAIEAGEIIAQIDAHQIVGGDTVEIDTDSLSAKFAANDKNVGTHKLQKVEVRFTGAHAKNYEFDSENSTCQGTVNKVTIQISGTLNLDLITDSDVKAALTEYLTYSKSAHKTIAITNSPLSSVPKVDNNNNKETGGYLTDGKGGVGLGGSHPYFYLPLEGLTAYGLTISNFYGIDYAGNTSDGAIFTIMLVTTAGDAGTYTYNGTMGEGAMVVRAEANIAEASLNDVKDNYAGTSGTEGDAWNSRWTFANFTDFAAEITIAKKQVDVTWYHHTSDRQYVELKATDGVITDSEHTYDGKNRCDEYVGSLQVLDGDSVSGFTSGRYSITSYTKPGSGAPESEVPTDIINAGTYILTLRTKDFGNYTVSESTDHITVVISPYTITSADLSALQNGWVNAAHDNNPLVSGTYNVEGEGSVTATNAFATHNAEGDRAAIFHDKFNIGHSGLILAESAYSYELGGELEETAGKHAFAATVTITISDTVNFKWADSYSFSDNYKLSAEATGNRLIVTKTWYVVDSINGAGLLVKSSWTFGDDITFTDPKLMHSEAAASSTYTLTLDSPYSEVDATLTKEWRGISYAGNEIQRYLNKSTPAGTYTLTLHIARWESGSVVYYETDVSYTITVSPATFSPADSDLKGEAFSAEYNGEVQLPGAIGSASNGIELTDGSWSVRTGVWADSEYDKYFTANAIEFSWSESAAYYTGENFKALSGGTFEGNVPKNVKLKATNKGGINIFEEDAYTVYYRFTAPNYKTYTNTFSMTIERLPIQVTLKAGASGKTTVTPDGKTVSWTYGTSLTRDDFSLVYTDKNGKPIPDSENLALIYAFYTSADTEFEKPAFNGSTNGDYDYPKTAGEYVWRLTFNNWISDGNRNNNYTFADSKGNLKQSVGSTIYEKPYILFDVKINKAEIGVNWSDVSNLTYSGSSLTPTATAEGITGTLTVTVTTQSGDPVAENKAINAGSYTATAGLTGIDATNYNLTNSEWPFTISPAPVDITWLVDGNTPAASYVYKGAGYAVTATTIWKGRSISFTFDGGRTFKDVNVDGYTFEVDLSQIDGSLAANFTTESKSMTFEVAKYQLTETDLAAVLNGVVLSKQYDGTDAATVDVRSIKMFNADTITFNVSATYNDKDAAISKSVTVVLGFSSEQQNYALKDAATDGSATYTLSGEITPRIITASELEAVLSIKAKDYDGSTAISPEAITAGKLSVIDGEEVEYTVTAGYADAMAGSGKDINVKVTIGDPNYMFENTDGTLTLENGVINRAVISADCTKTFTYNGADQRTELFNSVVLTRGSEAVVLDVNKTLKRNGYTVNYFTRAASYTLTVQLTGNDANNYTFESGSETTSVDLTVEMSKAKIEIGGNDKTVTYDGNAHTVEFTYPEYVIGAQTSVTYDGAAEAVNVKRLSDGTVTYYEVTLTVNGTDNYDSATKTVRLTIEPAKVEAVYTGKTMFTYTGESLWNAVMQNISVVYDATVAPEMVYTVLRDGTPVADNAITEVGSYVVTASLSSVSAVNFELTGAENGIVTLATISVNGKIIERIEWTGDAVCTYNGRDITAPTAKAVLVSGEEIELNVIGSVGKDVGTYTFTVETLSDYIYQSGLQMSFTVTVDPARVTIGKAVQRVVYNGTAYPIPEVELTWSDGTLQKGVDYTVTGTSGATNVGAYVYTVKLNSSNYTFRRGNTTTATLYIEAATVSIGEIAHVTYDGNAHTPELHLSWKGGDLTADAYTISGDAAVNAGSHTFTVTLKSANFRFSTGNDTRVELVIDKFALEKPAADMTEYVYNGSEHTYNIAQNDNYTVSNATRTNAGTQTVKVCLNDKRNTVWSDGTTQDVRYTFTVNKAQVTIDPVADVTVKYDGASHGVTVHVSDSTVPVIVTYNGYSVEPINAGAYSVAVTVPETENFEGETLDGITLRITKAVVTVKWSSQSVFTENGGVQTPYLGVDGADKSVVKVTYKSGSETLTGAPAAVGEYTVSVEAVSDNYELSGENEKTFSIKAASVEPQEPDAPEQPNEPEEPAASGNFDAVWYVMIAISVITLIFAVVSTVIYIKRSRV